MGFFDTVGGNDSSAATGAAIGAAAQTFERASGVLVQAFGAGVGAFAGSRAAVVTAPLSLSVGVAVGALALFSGALVSATREAQTYAREIANLRVQTGLSRGAALGSLQTGALFGFAPQQTSAILANNGNATLAALRAQSLGFAANPFSPAGLAQNAARFQSLNRGPFGSLIAGAFAGGGGVPDDPAYRALIGSLSPRQIREQSAFGANIDRAMSIGPETLRRYSEEIPLAVNRIGYAVSQARVKLAVELAPVIERTFTGIATYIGQNAGKIAGHIERVGKFLVFEFPPMLLRFGAGVAQGAGVLLQGVSILSRDLAANARPLLGVFDAILNGVRLFVAGLAGVGNIALGLASRALGVIPSGAGGGAQTWNRVTRARSLEEAVGGNASSPYAVASPVNEPMGPPSRVEQLFGRKPGQEWVDNFDARNLGVGGTVGIVGRASAPFLSRFAGRLFGRGIRPAAPGMGGPRGVPTMPPMRPGSGPGSGPGGRRLPQFNLPRIGTPRINPRLGIGAGALGLLAMGAGRFGEELGKRLPSLFGAGGGGALLDGMAGDFRDGFNLVYGNWAPSDMANNPTLVGGLERLLGGLSDASGRGAKTAFGLANWANEKADNWPREMLAEMKKTSRAVESLDEKTASLENQNAAFRAQLQAISARVSATVAEDFTYSILGAS